MLNIFVTTIKRIFQVVVYPEFMEVAGIVLAEAAKELEPEQAKEVAYHVFASARSSRDLQEFGQKVFNALNRCVAQDVASRIKVRLQARYSFFKKVKL